jgi:integrase
MARNNRRRGHVRQHGASWSAIVFEGRDLATGRDKYRWYGGFASKDAAEKKLTELLGQQDRGAYVPPSDETLAEFLRRWLAASRVNTRASTRAQRETLVEAHIIPRLGRLRLQQLSTATLNAFYGELLGTGRRDGKGGLSASSVAKIHGVLATALRMAIGEGTLVKAPTDGATPPRQRRPELKVWSAEEARVFLSSVRDDRLYPAFALALATGLRRGELLGLAWRDVNLEGRWLSVRQTLVSVNFEVKLSEPKTKAGRRDVAIDQSIVELLRAWRLQQLRERHQLNLPAQRPDDLVFSQPDGSPLHPGLFTDVFDRRVKRAGVPRIRFHDLRHTAATLMLKSGVHYKVVSERLGHANVSITLDLYTHSVPSLQEEAAAKMGRLLLGA